MTRKTGQRFTILDGMILVAAMALGLYVVRDYFRDDPRSIIPVSAWDPPWAPWQRPYEYPGGVLGLPMPPSSIQIAYLRTQLPLVVIVPLLPILVPCSLCVAGLVLLKERPSWRRAARRPEIWVGIATASVLAIRSLSLAIFQAIGIRLEIFEPYRFDSLIDFAWTLMLHPYPYAAPTEIGWVVAASWATLALGRRWRASPGLLGWLGITLGSAWIAMIPIFYFCIAMPRWNS